MIDGDDGDDGDDMDDEDAVRPSPDQNPLFGICHLAPAVGRLRFHAGLMGAGKSALAIQVGFHRRQAGRPGLIFTSADRAGSGTLSSRLGLSVSAREFTEETDFVATVGEALPARGFVIVDEAQFITPGQVDELALLVGRRRRLLRAADGLRLAHLPRLAAARGARRRHPRPRRGAVLVRPGGPRQRPHRGRRGHPVGLAGGRGRPGRGRGRDLPRALPTALARGRARSRRPLTRCDLHHRPPARVPARTGLGWGHQGEHRRLVTRRLSKGTIDDDVRIRLRAR